MLVNFKRCALTGIAMIVALSTPTMAHGQETPPSETTTASAPTVSETTPPVAVPGSGGGGAPWGWKPPSFIVAPAPPPTVAYHQVTVRFQGPRFFAVPSETLEFLTQREHSRAAAWQIVMTKSYAVHPISAGRGAYLPMLNDRHVYAPDCGRIPADRETVTLLPVRLPSRSTRATSANLSCQP
jgi:hypothetical protein